jgi:hypothetical protein
MRLHGKTQYRIWCENALNVDVISRLVCDRKLMSSSLTSMLRNVKSSSHFARISWLGDQTGVVEFKFGHAIYSMWYFRNRRKWLHLGCRCERSNFTTKHLMTCFLCLCLCQGSQLCDHYRGQLNIASNNGCCFDHLSRLSIVWSLQGSVEYSV